MQLTPEERKKQIAYRDARFSKQYDGIWQTVGKCVFCDLNPKYIFFEENGIVLTITLYAYIDGHMMIVPRRHVTSPKEFTPLEWQAVRKCMYIAKKLIKDVHGIGGMQIVQKDGAEAQSTVGHVHFHAIPFDAPDLCTWNYRQLENTPLENVALYQAANKKVAQLSQKFDQKYAHGKLDKNEQKNTGNEANDHSKNHYNLQWADLAFGSGKPLNKLKATFILAPREISAKRFTQLIRSYLPKGNIILGVATEPYVLGFEGQPQFKTLRAETLAALIKKVNASASPHKIYTLAYSQRDGIHVINKGGFKRVVGINGSWKYSFHTLPTFYEITKAGTPYELVSPFVGEAEAKAYEAEKEPEIARRITQNSPQGTTLTDGQMLKLASIAAQSSYDTSFQTGVVLGKKAGQKYQVLLTSFNKVVPFQTYAMVHGASRETHFSPPGDLNHYDAVHAEVEAVVKAVGQGVSLKGTSIFINLLPCPTCARMLAETDIAEVVYQSDHSDGYAVTLLEAAGKKVRRIAPQQREI